MNKLSQFSKRTTLATAMAVALGGTAALQTATAAPHIFAWEGLFTMLDPAGKPLSNTSAPYGSDATWGYGLRTPVSGTFTYDPDTGEGTIDVVPFEFFNGTAAAELQSGANSPVIENIGGNLLLGNMLFNWSGNNGIPVSIVWDATGMLNAIGAVISVGDTVTGTGETPASNGIKSGKYPLGPSPVATTSWDTTTINCTAGGGDTGECMGVLITGGEPLIEDLVVIGGSPMVAGPFPGFSANFDLLSMTLTSDGAVDFTAPDPISTDVPEDPLPASVDVILGSPTVDWSGPAPAGEAVEYCTDTVATCNADDLWVADVDPNTISVDIVQTVNAVTVQWRVLVDDVLIASDTQQVTATVDDNTPPSFVTLPMDVTVSVDDTSTPVTIASAADPAITATDAVEPDLTIQWSVNGFDWSTYNPALDTVATTGLGANANTVYWRVTDAAGNSVVHEQTVTLILPEGITGQPCVVDPDLLEPSIGNRLLEGVFTMRDPAGSNVGGDPDTAVYGSINTAVVCTDESCTDSGAELASPTPFFSLLWTTSAIRLFDQPGTYTFETCLDDGSSKCTAPEPLTMEVGPGQLGGHMLFNWGSSRNIDVVVVWDYSCGSAELVATDPDGDGIIGTLMVDGPFVGFNAAFDLSTASGEQPITTGGYKASIPTVKNSTPNASPLALEPGEIGTILGGVTITADELFDTYGATTDSNVLESCVGGCFDFEVSGLGTGDTIQVVLPLSEPIPWYALYRKYDAATDSWRTFAVTETDNVMTAPMDEDGFCPEPGAGDYSTNSSGIMANMLRPGDQCVQLTITDGGPNDTNDADGVIGDPSGVALTSAPAAPEAPTTNGGGCTLAADGTTPGQRFDLWLLAGLLGWLGLRRKQAS
jgi:hypothetical protein